MNIGIIAFIVSFFHFLSSLKNITILSPAFGSFGHNRFQISFISDPNEYEFIEFEVIGILTNLFPSNNTQISSVGSQHVEPASWFFTLTPSKEFTSDHIKSSANIDGIGFSNDGDDINNMYPQMSNTKYSSSLGYVEFVLTDDEILHERHFHTNEKVQPHNVTHVIQRSTSSLASLISLSKPPIHVCVWSTMTLDGQKSIWLQQIQFMNPQIFKFSWILQLKGNETLDDLIHLESKSAAKSLYSMLKELSNVNILRSPFESYAVNIQDLIIETNDDYPTAYEIWQNDEANIYRYAHYRYLIANHMIENIQPRWCQRLYTLIRRFLFFQNCQIVVFGNSRGFSSDVLITDTTRLLGIPTVAELLNLYTDPEIIPTVFVSPSQYALHHESIRHILDQDFERYVNGTSRLNNAFDNIRLASIQSIPLPMSVLIQPSVDTELFHRKEPVTSSADFIRSQLCSKTNTSHIISNQTNCFIIGFVARLAPEKNPGLFVMSTREILQRHENVRFLVIGDGLLRTHLIDLAIHYDILWAFHFTGWVNKKSLSQILSEVDVIVNPSLRGWSETFCISNIEVLSMEIPLITFGVGGIGEYVMKPVDDPHAFHQLWYDTIDVSSNTYKKFRLYVDDALNASCTNMMKTTSVVGNECEWIQNESNLIAAFLMQYQMEQGYSISSNAILVNTATPIAINHAVELLLENPKLRINLGKRGRQSVLNYFTVDRQMNQYKKLYLSIANGDEV